MTKSSKPTDELLEALVSVGLGLWMFDNTEPAKWRCVLYDPTSPLNRWEGNAETPAGAILAALSAAGIEARDE